MKYLFLSFLVVSCHVFETSPDSPVELTSTNQVADPDSAITRSSHSSELLVSGATEKTRDIDLVTNLAHTATGEFTATLVSLSGTSSIISSQNGVGEEIISVPVNSIWLNKLLISAWLFSVLYLQIYFLQPPKYNQSTITKSSNTMRAKTIKFYALLLVLVFSSTPIFASIDHQVRGENLPFIYAPEITTDFKRMKIDDDAILVVTANRFSVGDLPQQIHLVIYSLDHSRSLNWITEDEVDLVNTLDSVITEHSVYVLNRVMNVLHKTEVWKFSRDDGSLIWRKAINETANAAGQILKVDESTDTMVVTGVVDEVTYIWRYDTSGSFLSHWSEDLEPFTGVFGSGNEVVHTLHLLHDKSVIISSYLQVDHGVLRVLRVADDNQKLFEYSRQGKIFITHDENFSLIASANNHFFISYSEEDDFGIPRLNQFVLDDMGDEIFITRYENISRIRNANNTGHLLHDNGQVLSVTRSSDLTGELEIFQTNFTGKNNHIFNYSYTGNGHSMNLRQIALGGSNNLFMVASIQNPFPDFFNDTLYIQFNMDGQVCNEIQIDGVDFYSQIQYHDQNFYELRYIGENVLNGRQLHVVKHPRIPACVSEIIFESGFE